MRNYIIITKEQADRVRGRHGKYSALEPVEFPDGMYGIPERCLSDPEFEDIKETLIKYQKEGIVQDITDLNEKALSTAIEKDKYYLSSDYWVVKALKSETVSLSSVSRLTSVPDKILIRKDIADFVDAEKDALEPKPKSFFARTTSYARATVEETVVKTKGIFGRLWDWIKKVWKSIFG
jgi:hypothetical protein